MRWNPLRAPYECVLTPRCGQNGTWAWRTGTARPSGESTPARQLTTNRSLISLSVRCNVRGFDFWYGLPLSHDYGCTDHPGPDTNCPRWAQQTCGAAGALGG